jgi:hypothetical protein
MAKRKNLWDQGIVYSQRNGGLYVRAEWSQAAAPILWAFTREEVEADEWQSGPYQVADANHDRSKAIRLVANYTK